MNDVTAGDVARQITADAANVNLIFVAHGFAPFLLINWSSTRDMLHL
jgi:hypothetical protein